MVSCSISVESRSREASKLRRKAETAYKAKKRLWEEATEVARNAKEAGIDAPTPPEEPTLESVFMTFTGKSLDDDVDEDETKEDDDE